jgi:hypothetical protein
VAKNINIPQTISLSSLMSMILEVDKFIANENMVTKRSGQKVKIPSPKKSLMSTILEVDKFDCKCKHGRKKKWPKE